MHYCLPLETILYGASILVFAYYLDKLLSVEINIPPAITRKLAVPLVSLAILAWWLQWIDAI